MEGRLDGRLLEGKYREWKGDYIEGNRRHVLRTFNGMSHEMTDD